MRSILFALSFGVAAATVAYAHVADHAIPARSAGTLTCTTLPNVSLVFGKTRVATCVFEGEAGFTQVYGAILPEPADAAGERPTLVWRVVTAGGTSRPGQLDGTFTRAMLGADLIGAAAQLEPIAAAESRVILGASDAHVEIGALTGIPSSAR